MKPRIRQYAIDDSEAVRDLYIEFVNYHAQLDPYFQKVEDHPDLFIKYLNENCHNEQYNIMVAEVEGQVIAYCVSSIDVKPPVYPDRKYGYIDNICVRDAFQNQGVGSQLLREIRSWFIEKGVRQMECFAAVSNPKSTTFWRKMGFQPLMEQLCCRL